MSRTIDENPHRSSSPSSARPTSRNTTPTSHGHLRESRSESAAETGVAGLWLVFYAVIIGASLFSHGGASKLSTSPRR